MGAEIDGLDSLVETLDSTGRKWDKAVVYYVGTNVPYAPAVEFGSRAHTVEGNPLSFEIGGEQVFATTAEIPAQDPNPFMRRALDRVEAELPELAKQADSVDGFVWQAAATCERYMKEEAPVETGNLAGSIKFEEL